MRFKSIATAVAVGLITCLTVSAQRIDKPDLADAEPEPQFPRRSMPTWSYKGPGGEIEVSLESIRFVSMHSFEVDGVGLVHEMNIATDSAFNVRFFSVAPVEAGPVDELASLQEAARRAEESAAALAAASGAQSLPRSVAELVVKKVFPATTHAATVEFAVENRERLEAIFQSARKAWKNFISESFAPDAKES